MDAADSSSRKPAQLTARQTALVNELRQISTDPDLASMFVGACHAVQDKSNPDYLAQAAHSLRELMEKLEGARGLPVADPVVAEAKGKLGDKARELHAKWQAAQKKSKCLAQKSPATEIDPPLRKFIGHVDDFFKWVTNNRKLWADKPGRLVKGLDPLAASLPQNVQDAQAQEWKAIDEYFQTVTHHGSKPELAQFEATMAALEVFLHSRLAPTKAQNQHDLQKLISEVEA